MRTTSLSARLASRVARVLTGKHKPSWTPFLDCGDHVIVLNAARVRLTGRKEEQKMYYRTSGRPGGLKSRTAAQVRSSHPERLVESAVPGDVAQGKPRAFAVHQAEGLFERRTPARGPAAGTPPRPPRPVILMTEPLAYGTGKRKSSIARVYLRNGSGEILVNQRPLADYFPRETYQNWVTQPLLATDQGSAVDIDARVKGGGLSGQAAAVRLGIARALSDNDARLRPELKRRGFLTRDARRKERKKYGQPGARKRFQYSKR